MKLCVVKFAPILTSKKNLAYNFLVQEVARIAPRPLSIRNARKHLAVLIVDYRQPDIIFS